MTKVAITESYLEDIADAIRAKTGVSSATYYPSEMANAIMTISGSGGITPTGTISITENGTYNVASYASADVSVSSGNDFVITLTYDSQDEIWKPDCTFAQVSAAYSAGKTISAKIDEMYCATDIWIESSDPDPLAFVCEVAWFDENEEKTAIDTYYWHVEDGWLLEGRGYSIMPVLETTTRTYTPSTTAQTDTITPSQGYDGIEEVSITVNAMPSGTAGTPIASKGSVSNHAVTVTPSVTNSTGYITGSTKTGTAVTVSASELVSGNKAISSNGINIDVTNYATVSVDVPTGGGTPTINSLTVTPTESEQTFNSSSVDGYKPVTVDAISSTYVGSGITRRSSTDLTVSGATVTVPAGYYSSQATKAVSNGSASGPSTISGTSATVSTGTNTLTLTKTVSVTPTVSAGYVSSGTATNSSVSLTASVTTKAAATITPGTTNQTIASGTYLTGTQTIAGDANLVASNIVSGVQIFGVTGNVVLQNYYTGSSAPSSSTGSNGDLYLQS